MADQASDDQGMVMITVVGFLLGFTTIFMALRFYTRVVLTDSLWWDDWATLFAFFLAAAEGVIMCIHNSYGQGKHIKTLDPSTVREFYKILYITIVIYYFCLGVIKTAILLQYYRIFASRMRRVAVWAMIIIGTWSLSLVFVSAFMCIPVPGFWDKTINATCVSTLRQWYINAGGNIATDLIIFVMPIPVLWKLHLPLSQRLSLIGVFALGFFTCAISALRITFLDHGDDMSYKNIGPAGWSLGELCCAIIVSCLPTLRPVLGRMLPSVFSTRLRTTQLSRGPLGFHDITTDCKPPHMRSSHPTAGHRLYGQGPYGDNFILGTTIERGGESEQSLCIDRRDVRPIDRRNHGSGTDAVSEESITGLAQAVAHMRGGNQPSTLQVSSWSAVSRLTEANGGAQVGH